MTTENKYLQNKEQEFIELMNSYLEMKKESLNIGFNETGIKFRDYLDIYLFNKKE